MAAFVGWRLTRTGILFIVGILVLGGLVTGGIFLVKNHGEAVRHDQAVKVAEQNLKDSSKTPTTDTKASDASNAGSSTGTATATNSGATTTPGTSTATNATSTTASTPAALPTTGPNTLVDLGNILAVTILALSVAFYVSSRSSTAKTHSRL